MISYIFLIYSVPSADSTEVVVIQRMIDASQRMLTVNSQGGGLGEEEGGINLVMNKHLELQIKTLQDPPRDADKLRKLLEVKQRQKEQAMQSEYTRRLVTEIEILKAVLYLACRKQQ